MLRFLTLFVVIVVALFAAELTPPAQHALVVPWTEVVARLSAALITPFDSHVLAYGRVLQSTAGGFAVSIEAGCNGVEACLLLVAAMLAFPAPWMRKLLGIAGGVLAVQLLNLVRVVSLFYLGQWNRSAFEWAHLYVWQTLIMVDVLVVWLIWLRWVRNGDPPRAAA